MNELAGQEGLAGVEWDKICGPGGIKVQWAKKKLKEGEKPEGADKNWKVKGKAPAPAPQPKEEDEVAQEETKTKWRPGVWDHNASRTVVVLGLPMPGEAGSTEEAEEGDEQDGDEEKMDVDAQAESSTAPSAAKKGKQIDWKKALKQRAKKIGDVEDILFPVEMASGEQAGASQFPFKPPSLVLTCGASGSPRHHVHTPPRARPHEQAEQPRLPRRARLGSGQELVGPVSASRAVKGRRTVACSQLGL